MGAFFARKDTFGMTRFQLKRMNESWLVQKGQKAPNGQAESSQLKNEKNSKKPES